VSKLIKKKVTEKNKMGKMTMIMEIILQRKLKRKKIKFNQIIYLIKLTNKTISYNQKYIRHCSILMNRLKKNKKLIISSKIPNLGSDDLQIK
jgi:hypothetical protein